MLLLIYSLTHVYIYLYALYVNNSRRVGKNTQHRAVSLRHQYIVLSITVELMIDVTLLRVEMSVLGIHWLNVSFGFIRCLPLRDLLVNIDFSMF